MTIEELKIAYKKLNPDAEYDFDGEYWAVWSDRHQWDNWPMRII